MLGRPIRSTPHEQRRRLLHGVRIKQASKVAMAAGYTWRPGRELEKMYDFLSSVVLAKLEGPIPSSSDELLGEMRHAVGIADPLPS
jgi:hypothetical protein